MWFVFLAVLAVLLLLSVALPVPRRVWAFALISTKYLLLWLADAIGLRRAWYGTKGQADEYQ